MIRKIALALAVFACTAHAAPPTVVQTGFEEFTANSALNGQNGWTAGSPWEVTTPGFLFFPPIKEGSKAVRVITDNLTAGVSTFAWKTTSPIGTGYKFIASTYITHRGPTVGLGSSTGGLAIYGLDGFGNNNAQVGKVMLSPSGTLTLTGATTRSRSGVNTLIWNKIELYADFSTQKLRVRLNGVDQGWEVNFLANRVLFNDGDLMVTANGKNTWYFDYHRIHYSTNFGGPYLVAGKLNLEGWQASAGSLFGTLHLVDDSNVDIKTSFGLDLDPDGHFVQDIDNVNTLKSYWTYVKAPKWLRKQTPNTISFFSGGAIIDMWEPITLLGGDCNGDNTVSTDDYLIINNSFDRSNGDAGYNAQADLDGNLYVGTDDYLILSNNFDVDGTPLPTSGN